MSTTVPFHVLQIVPDRVRGEVMNVGVALVTPQGPDVRLRLLPSRLRALSPTLGRMDAQEWLDAWHAALARIDGAELRWTWLRTAMAPLQVCEAVGTLHAENDADLEMQVEAVLTRMVMPLKAERKLTTPRPRRSRLNGQITAWLRQQQLYSRNMQDLTKNRVVSSYPLSLDEELFAEFALKNGVVHVMETLDLRGHDSYTKTLRNEASFKAMVLDLAEDSLPTSQRIAVVAADNYGDMKPAFSLLNRKATHVVNMDSSQDRQWLADFVSEALHVTSLLPPAPAAHSDEQQALLN